MRKSGLLLAFFVGLMALCYTLWPTVQKAFVERALKEYAQRSFHGKLSYDSLEVVTRNTMKFRGLRLSSPDGAYLLEAPEAGLYVSLNLRKRLLTAKLSLEDFRATLPDANALVAAPHKSRYFIRPAVSLEGAGKLSLKGVEFPASFHYEGAQLEALSLRLGESLILKEGELTLRHFPLLLLTGKAPFSSAVKKGFLSGSGTAQEGGYTFEALSGELLGLPLEKGAGKVTYSKEGVSLSLLAGTLRLQEEHLALQGEVQLQKKQWNVDLTGTGSEATFEAHLTGDEKSFSPGSYIAFQGAHFSGVANPSGLFTSPIPVEAKGDETGWIAEPWTLGASATVRSGRFFLEGMLQTDRPSLRFSAELGKEMLLSSCSFVAEDLPLACALPYKGEKIALQGAFSASGRFFQGKAQMELSAADFSAEFRGHRAFSKELTGAHFVYDSFPQLTLPLRGFTIDEKLTIHAGTLATERETLSFSGLHLETENVELFASGEFAEELVLYPSTVKGKNLPLKTLCRALDLPEAVLSGRGEFYGDSAITLYPMPKLFLQGTFQEGSLATAAPQGSIHGLSGKLFLDTETKEFHAENLRGKTAWDFLELSGDVHLRSEGNSSVDLCLEEAGKDLARLRGLLTLSEGKVAFQADTTASHLLALKPTKLHARFSSEALEFFDCEAELIPEALPGVQGWIVSSKPLTLQTLWNPQTVQLEWSLRGEEVAVGSLPKEKFFCFGTACRDRFSLDEMSYGEVTIGAEMHLEEDVWKVPFLGGRFGQKASFGFAGTCDKNLARMDLSLQLLACDLSLFPKISAGEFRSKSGHLRVTFPEKKLLFEMEGRARDLSLGEAHVSEGSVQFALDNEEMRLSCAPFALLTPEATLTCEVPSFSLQLAREEWEMDGAQFALIKGSAKKLLESVRSQLPALPLNLSEESALSGRVSMKRSPWEKRTSLYLDEATLDLLGYRLQAPYFTLQQEGQRIQVETKIPLGVLQLGYLDLPSPYGTMKLKGENLVGQAEWRQGAVQNLHLETPQLKLDLTPSSAQLSAGALALKFSLEGGSAHLLRAAYENRALDLECAPITLNKRGTPALCCKTLLWQHPDAKILADVAPFIDPSAKVEELSLRDVRLSLLSGHPFSGTGRLLLSDRGKKKGLTPKARVDQLIALPKLRARSGQLDFSFSPQGVVLEALQATDAFRLAKMEFAQPGLCYWNGSVDVSLHINPKPVPFVKVYPILMHYTGELQDPHVALERLDRPSD